MNIDDFLDQTSEQDTSDIIDISMEDTTPQESSEPKPVDPKSADSSVPRPTSSHASVSKETESQQKPVTVSDVEQSKKSQNAVSSISPAATFVQNIRMHVSNIKSSLDKKDLQEAMHTYGLLVQLTHKIPASNESAKHKVDTLLLQVNNDIQKVFSDEKTRCIVTSKKIELLIGQGTDYLLDKNYAQAQNLYAQITALFETLPSYFSDQKHEVNTHIIQYHLKLTNYKKRETSARFKQEFNKIKSLLYDLSMLIASNKFVEASRLYKDIEAVYESMEEGFLDERSKIYAVMLKKKHTIDVAIQIQSLQQELGVKKDTVFEEPRRVSDIPKPIAHTIHTTEPVVTTSAKKEHTVSEKAQPEKTATPTMQPYSKDSLINEAIKNVKVSKAKILLMNQQFAEAFLLLSELRKRFPGDESVEEVYSQLKHNPQAPTTEALQTEAAYVAQELKRVDADLAKGNLSGAIKDLEKIEAEESNVELKGILKNLEQAIAHKPGEFEKEDAVFIRRKLLLAKHHYDKHNFSKTKEYASLVLTHDPKNKEAKQLYSLVS